MIDKELKKRVKCVDTDLELALSYYMKDFPDLKIIYTGSLEYSSLTICLSPDVAKKIMQKPKFKEWCKEYSLDDCKCYSTTNEEV